MDKSVFTLLLYKWNAFEINLYITVNGDSF